MAFPSKKRKSAAIVDDDSDVDTKASNKRGKDSSGAATMPSGVAQVDDDGSKCESCFYLLLELSISEGPCARPFD
jgi:hypothetical protein